MALFPQTFLDDLKSQTDIVAVVGDVVPLKKAGATWKGLCPFHTEKTPSFTVNRDKGVFHCFGCGVGGDVVSFVEQHQKIAFPEAVRYLAQRAGIPVPEPTGSAEDRQAAAERDAIVEGLKVVDAAAFSLCMENKLPMVVFGMEGAGNITRALLGERIGTLVTNA